MSRPINLPGRAESHKGLRRFGPISAGIRAERARFRRPALAHLTLDCRPDKRISFALIIDRSEARDGPLQMSNNRQRAALKDLTVIFRR